MKIDIDPNQKTLDLGHKKLGDEETEGLASELKNNHTHTKLNFQFNKISAEGARHLAAALKENDSLKTVALDGNDLDDKGISYLAAALQENHSIRTLTLEYNKIGAKGAGYLADALKKNDSLETLDLQSNGIEAEGAGYLAAALKDNHSLTTLDLRGRSFDGKTADQLVDALKENTTLTTLNLFDNKIDEDTQEKIRDLLTRNKVIARMRKTTADISTAETMLGQKTSTEEVVAILNQISDAIDTLKGYGIQTDAFTDEITDFENRLSDLIVGAHLQAGDIDSALLQYDNTRTSQSAFLLAEYLFANELLVNEDKEKRLHIVLNLLREAWTHPRAQNLTAQVTYSLYHLDETMGSVGADCQTVFGIKKVIPLSVIEKSISRAETLSDEEEGEHWKVIKQHLSRLSSSRLYQLCQLPPLAEVLQRDIGTQHVTSFFHLSHYKDDYPLLPQEKEVKLSEVTAEIQRSLRASAAERRAQQKTQMLEKKDEPQEALEHLIAPLRIEKERVNVSHYDALIHMKRAYVAKKLTAMTLPDESLQSLYTRLHEILKNVKEGYDAGISYTNDYQACVEIATLFSEQVEEDAKHKSSSFFASPTESPHYKEFADFMRDIKAGTFLKKIVPQETHAFPSGPRGGPTHD